MSLPPPAPNQAYCLVSPLDAGIINAPLAWQLDNAGEDERVDCPVLCFLVRHTSKPDTLLFDLGVRKDWETGLPPALVAHATTTLDFKVHLRQDVVAALAAGGLHPTSITRVLLSHLHLDHIGDTALFPPPTTFLVGPGARALAADTYPTNPASPLPAGLLPPARTTFLDPSSWPPLGPFPHALDLYGDGSAYVVDAGAGHIPGHLNLLLRTSPDGAWLLLAGDSAHHWRILDGTARIAHHPVYGCAHVDVAAAELHLERIRALMRGNTRVRVLLAHDEPWYRENKDGPAFWPGTLESL